MLAVVLFLSLLPTAAKGDEWTEPITPLPQTLLLDPGKVALGERLFSDPRLSGDGTVSCATCHSLDTAGVDRAIVSTGVGGAKGSVNAPTVFNSGFNFKQFWDGRAATLEEQVAGPIHNPLEMNSSWGPLISRLKGDGELVATVRKLYGADLTPAVVQDAIATFERSLVTPDARFDRYLRGDGAALDGREKRGYVLFREYGCVSCHQGVNVGGNMFQVFGVMGDYFRDRGGETKADQGRYNVTKREEDRHVFKVPSLRNVALTPPYFHDGSAATLERAVEVMARYQLGRRLAADEEGALVAFLRSLTGTWRGRPLR
ncbi:MAG: cytochrome-c peroxidase [Nitrospinae bacterium]|nr:cytochrome-c peroxidase [Nitrospinota bacterium]